MPSQFNAYSYAWNNPVTQSDPTGLKPLGMYDCYSCGGTPKGKGSAPRGKGQPGAGAIGGSNQAELPWIQQRADDIGQSPFGQYFAENPIGAVVDEDGIIYTTAEPPQFLFLYMNGYDRLFEIGAPMRSAVYQFEYNHNSYRLEVWVGDYPGWGAGGESEIFWQEGPLEDAGPVWTPGTPGEMPLLSTNVTRMGGADPSKGGKVASFAPTTPQAWAGTWNKNLQNVPIGNLFLDVTATFPNDGMYNAFKNSRAVLFDQNQSHLSFPDGSRTARITL